MSEPGLSVIIPCHGRVDALERLLAGFAAQTLDRDRYEVLLVDDGNAPPLGEVVAAALLVGVLVLRLDPNGGPAAAKNLGLRRARGRVVLFLNADALLTPTTLAGHLAQHAEGAPARAVLGRFDPLASCRSTILEVTARAGLWFPFGAMTPGQPHSGRYFWTCNLSVPTAAVRRAGGFDARFRRPAWEDVELGHRLDRRGVAVFHHPEIGCGHDHALDLDGFVRRSQLIGHEWVRLAQKHGPAAVPLYEDAPAPDEAFAAALLGLLVAAGAETAAAYATLAGASAELDALLVRDPAAFDAALERRVDELGRLLRRVDVHEMARGTLGAICGFSTDEVARTARGDERFSVVTAGERAPDDAEVVVQVPAGQALTAAELATLRDFFAVSPAIGAIGLVAPASERAGALLSERLPAGVRAHRRRGGPLQLVAWPGRAAIITS